METETVALALRGRRAANDVGRSKDAEVGLGEGGFLRENDVEEDWRASPGRELVEACRDRT